MLAKADFLPGRFVALLGLLVSLVIAPAALAQSTAAIQGAVTDPSGAIVPNAAVLVRNLDTGEERTTQTDTFGLYTVASLPVGTYRVEVKAPGMQTVASNNVVLDVNRTTVLNFNMKVAAASETIEVTAAAPVLERNSIAVGQVISGKTVQDIGLNGRHFVDLGFLIAGSTTNKTGFLTAPLRGQGPFAFNTAGNREDAVNFLINGINLSDMAQNQITFQPSINTIQEFKVDNSTYSAESGRNSGAIVNIATRSGTNQFHGEVFEFVRNNYFDARNYFNRVGITQSPFKRNQFGAAVGGPVVRDKTFFFVTYEGLRQRQGIDINHTVLTDAQRSQATTVGNPTVVKFLPLIPRPNLGNNFVGSATAPVNIDQGTANVSHVFGGSDRLSGYLALQEDLRQEPTLQGNNIPGWGDTRQSRRQIMTLNETHVFSPAVVNEARLGYNRIHIVFSPNVQLNPADFGINNSISTALGLPQIALNDIGLNFGGPAGFPQGRGDYTAVFSDSLTYVRGKHSFKFGGEFRRFNGNSFNPDIGRFTFATVNDFINGNAIAFSANPTFNSSRVYVNALGFFVQDSYKIRPRLTLELGLRYDWNGTPTEAQNRFVEFDPATGALLQVGKGLDGVYKQNARNFEPRVGFAWDLFGTGKTVLRAAYGLQTDQPVANLVGPLANLPPFSTPLAFNSSTATPFITFANAVALAKAGGLAPTTVNHDFRNSYVQSRNINVQQQITGSLGMMVGYFGSEGTHLRIQRNINQFINGARPYPTVSAGSAILPGNPLGNIFMNDSAGISNYNALWITANKRFSKGLEFNTSYTFSKSIDYNSLSSQGTVVQDSYHIRNERGLSDFDARHRFVIGGVYELPFKGNRVIEGWQFSLGTALQTGNPMNIVQTSNAFTGVATLRPDVVGPVSIGLRPVANSINMQYISACTAANCPFSFGNRFGSLGRNVFTGPGTQNVDISLRKNTHITEKVQVQFRADVFNVFNHPNFANPNLNVSSAAGNTFGQISATAAAAGDSGSSRQIQLAMKLTF